LAQKVGKGLCTIAQLKEAGIMEPDGMVKWTLAVKTDGGIDVCQIGNMPGEVERYASFQTWSFWESDIEWFEVADPYQCKDIRYIYYIIDKEKTPNFIAPIDNGSEVE